MQVFESNSRPSSAPAIWAVTTGESGTRGQAVGLADAIGGRVAEYVVSLRRPWSLLRADLAPFALKGLDPGCGRLQPPWPDLLVTCGRRSAAVAIAVRRASRGRTLTVHIGDPRAPARNFDLVFPMAHDRLRGANVLPVLTSLHGLDPLRFAVAAESWRARLARLPRPLTGVLVGGAVRGRAFGAKQAAALVRHLDEKRGGLIVTTSRRTPELVREALSAALEDREGAWLWDGRGDNPYLAILALSDELVVTSDSVSMISEALATDLPVRIFDLGLPGRHARFLQTLLAEGLAGRLGAEPAPAERRRVDATTYAARRVRELLRSRGLATASEVVPEQRRRSLKA